MTYLRETLIRDIISSLWDLEESELQEVVATIKKLKTVSDIDPELKTCNELGSVVVISLLDIVKAYNVVSTVADVAKVYTISSNATMEDILSNHMLKTDVTIVLFVPNIHVKSMQELCKAMAQNRKPSAQTYIMDASGCIAKYERGAA